METIHRLRELLGIAGVHIMAFRQRNELREVIERAGLKNRSRWVANKPNSKSFDNEPR